MLLEKLEAVDCTCFFVALNSSGKGFQTFLLKKRIKKYQKLLVIIDLLDNIFYI